MSLWLTIPLCIVAAVPIALLLLWFFDRLFGEDLPDDTYYDFTEEQKKDHEK